MGLGLGLGLGLGGLGVEPHLLEGAVVEWGRRRVRRGGCLGPGAGCRVRGLTLASMVLNSRLEMRPEPSRSARQKAAHSLFSKPLRWGGSGPCFSSAAWASAAYACGGAAAEAAAAAAATEAAAAAAAVAAAVGAGVGGTALAKLEGATASETVARCENSLSRRGAASKRCSTAGAGAAALAAAPSACCSSGPVSTPSRSSHGAWLGLGLGFGVGLGSGLELRFGLGLRLGFGFGFGVG